MGPQRAPAQVATPLRKGHAKVPSGCQLGELFRLLGESHVLDILYLFMADARPRRFVEIQNELKMSPNTLSDRLRGLVKAGLLTRTAYNEIPPRVEYEATPKAFEFRTVFAGLSAWAKRNTLAPAPAAVAAP